jgi:hypothetical protein
MVMDKLPLPLHSLSQRAAELAEETARSPEALTALEDALQEMNLGVEVFLEYTSLKETDWVEGAEGARGDQAPTVFESWVLGYGQSQAKHWGFLVRHYHCEKAVDEEIEMTLIESTPLVHAARELRIAAAEQLPALLEVLEHVARETLESLRKVSDR